MCEFDFVNTGGFIFFSVLHSLDLLRVVWRVVFAFDNLDLPLLPLRLPFLISLVFDKLLL